MLSFTIQELTKNPQFIQRQADIEPVVIANQEKKQILLNYDDYVRLIKQEDSKKSFNNAYEYFNTTLAEDFTKQELEILANIEDDSDMSVSEQS